MSASNPSNTDTFAKTFNMIQELLSNIEMDVKYKIFTEQKNLTAIKTIKELINQIDHDAEVVPLENKEKLLMLMVSLKGKELNENECRLIDKLVENSN